MGGSTTLKRREGRLPGRTATLCVHGLPNWGPEKGLRWAKDPITRSLTAPVKIWVSILR